MKDKAHISTENKGKNTAGNDGGQRKRENKTIEGK